MILKTQVDTVYVALTRKSDAKRAHFTVAGDFGDIEKLVRTVLIDKFGTKKKRKARKVDAGA